MVAALAQSSAVFLHFALERQLVVPAILAPVVLVLEPGLVNRLYWLPVDIIHLLLALEVAPMQEALLRVVLVVFEKPFFVDAVQAVFKLLLISFCALSGLLHSL